MFTQTCIQSSNLTGLRTCRVIRVCELWVGPSVGSRLLNVKTANREGGSFPWLWAKWGPFLGCSKHYSFARVWPRFKSCISHLGPSALRLPCFEVLYWFLPVNLISPAVMSLCVCLVAFIPVIVTFCPTQCLLADYCLSFTSVSPNLKWGQVPDIIALCKLTL